MSKIDINNEVVLMRHSVRRARVQVLRKLVRQSKMLRVKKGDDKQREKYKRKADKLGDEIAAMKKIPDDEVTRYSITNERRLAEVLNDTKSEPETCVLARLSSHKIMKNRVEEFKKKFPNFAEHLGPGRKKIYKMKRKAGKMAGKMAEREAKLNSEKEPEENLEAEESLGENDGAQESEEGTNIGMESEDSSPEKKRVKTTAKISPSKVKSGDKLSGIIATSREGVIKCLGANDEAEKSEEVTKIGMKSEDGSPEKKRVKIIPPKVKCVDKLSGIIASSRVGAIKSLASFLEEKNEGELGVVEEEKEGKMVLEKEVDSFFMTEDGAGEYLSVVVPKSKETEEERESEKGFNDRNEWKNSARSRNNRFFDKVEGREEKFTHRNRKDDGPGRGDNNFREKNTVYGKRERGDYRHTNKTEIKEMHPSWAAKKKEQDILKLGFQGKKIVFDDV